MLYLLLVLQHELLLLVLYKLELCCELLVRREVAVPFALGLSDLLGKLSLQ